jgi:hypothetical protein
VEGNRVHREEYGCYLLNEGVEVWGEERDLSHEPAVHRHVGPNHAREVAEPISFRDAVERAWEDVARIHQFGA